MLEDVKEECMNKSIYNQVTTYKLFKIAFPSILMMVFMSLYTIVDGIFISRFLGSSALSSLNIVYPVISLTTAIATMLASGGTAIISRKLGEQNEQTAREYLTQFVVLGLIISLILMIMTQLFLTPISLLLGANQKLLPQCNEYLSTMMYFAPAAMLQALFQCYFVAANRPSLGLNLSIFAGITNVVLDYFFIAKLHLGISGAALATGLGQMIPAITGLILFIFNKDQLYFVKFKFDIKAIMEACYNGSSEMVTQLSNAIMTFLFNIVLMRLAGENGVAAITILLYAEFLFNAFYLGFSMGISPVVGYKYGAKDKKELKHIYKVSFIFVACSSFVITMIAFASLRELVGVFTQAPQTYQLTVEGFKIFAFNFLFSGINITTSGFFTALSNGKISAIISFCRTLVFTGSSLIILSAIFALTGTWLAIPVAELLTFILSMYFHYRYFIKKSEVNYFQLAK